MVAELAGALALARIEPSITRSNVILTDSRRIIKQRLALEN
jgi:hypothetical protein